MERTERYNEGLPEAILECIKRDPKDLISNVITEMICQGCSESAIMDAVVLSRMIIDNEKKEK